MANGDAEYHKTEEQQNPEFSEQEREYIERGCQSIAHPIDHQWNSKRPLNCIQDTDKAANFLNESTALLGQYLYMLNRRH